MDAGADAGDASPSKAQLTMNDFIGINAFIDDPTAKLTPIGNVREYHNWSWIEGNGASGYPGYPNNQDSFVLFGGTWNWDTYFSSMQQAGLFAYPVVQGGVAWLNNSAVPPVAANADPTMPASYAAHADVMFQFAARYGKTTVADSLLKLASGQPRSSGLGTVGYYEDWNEEDAWWILPNNQPLFSPAVYAAMASADYDGDQQRMGTTVGVKNADPTAKMVMGGLSGQGQSLTDWETNVTTYVDGIRTWAAMARGGSFPADVINFHFYDFGTSSVAVSPEAIGLKDTMSLLKAYRDANLPGTELWITEFGFDTDPQSVLHAPAIGPNSATVVQGQWIVREYLALVAAGFDRAFLFVSRDSCNTSDSACATQFDTSGVMGIKGDWTPKTSYYFIATLRNRLASFAYLGEQTSGNANVLVYKFKDPKSSAGAYVVWAPTSNATTVPGYVLAVGRASTVSAVALTDGSMTGTSTALTPAASNVQVDVSETPTIVLVDTIN